MAIDNIFGYWVIHAGSNYEWYNHYNGISLIVIDTCRIFKREGTCSKFPPNTDVSQCEAQDNFRCIWAAKAPCTVFESVRHRLRGIVDRLTHMTCSTKCIIFSAASSQFWTIASQLLFQGAFQVKAYSLHDPMHRLIGVQCKSRHPENLAIGWDQL